MIYRIPENWDYNESMEMLYLFYQKADELLSETSPDTYALPLHNSMTLLKEVEEIFDLLNKYGMLADYYSKYIPPILEELLEQIENDYILKKILGSRLFSIRTGLTEAQKNHAHLKGWINAFKQACILSKYRKAYMNEIIHLVSETKDKNKLLYSTSCYFTCLIHMGYSREYLYTMTKKFFCNKDRKINSSEQIKEYFNLFSCRHEEFTFLILMDIDSIEYMDSISDNLTISRQIERVDVSKERKDLCKDFIAEELIKEFDRKVREDNPKRKMAVVRFQDHSYDPYCSAEKFCDYIRFIQTFTRYFKHFYFTKQVYKIIYLASDGYYKEIKLPGKMQKRPYVQQEVIDSRIKNILQAKSMGFESFMSLTQAIEMHAEAFDSRSTTTLLRTFWTALETLFSNQTPNSSRENVVNSLLPIIQKTYILKNLRAVHSQLCGAMSQQSMKVLGIADFEGFVKYFSAHTEDSIEMKKIYEYLSENPLLRTRLFSLRKALADGKSIAEFLDSHRVRVEWQIKRLYRMRNIATHLGVEVSGVGIAANHLHNYFDYAVNYMLCKSENGDYVISTSAVVFEAKNDNRIHSEMLKENKPLSLDNYIAYLFGPDGNLINYQFEY